MVWHARSRTRAELNAERFRQDLTSAFYEASNDASLLEGWVKRARCFPPAVAREFLLPYLQATTGSVRENMRTAYLKLGLLDEDLRRSKSRLWNRRLIAMRHLWVVANGEQLPVLLERLEDIYPIRILLGGILSRVGATDDFLRLISRLDVPRRVMEQPIWGMVRDMPHEEFGKIALRWSEIESSYMRRIVLIRSARSAPLTCQRWLSAAAESEDVNLRIAACGAISELAVSSLLELAVSLLQDAAWEVRLHAVDSIGKIRSADCLHHLARAMGDSAYWVRQHAARAIYRFGLEGRNCLEAIVAAGQDSFAADAATEELDRQQHAAAGVLL